MPLLARWPGRIEAGSRSDALVALTDTMATLAELLGRTLPSGAGPDSFSYLGALLGQAPTQPVRNTLVHESYRGGFGIREGDWKLMMVQGGGGIGWSPFDLDRDQIMTFNKVDYRPDPDGTESLREGQQRMGAHSDYTTYTLLLADPVPGLQILDPDVGSRARTMMPS